MVQFNLLPDVKLEYIEARRTKRLVLLGAIVVSAVSIFVLLLFIVTVDVVQKKTLSDVSGDIKTDISKLQGTQDLDKVLTVQNQLNTLPGLHDKKVVTSRLFSYLSQITPNGVSISSLNVDFTQYTMTVSGDATDFATISKLIDTLKATNYETDKQTTPTKAFSKVVLNSYSRGDSTGKASYSTNFSYDPAIFDSANQVKLDVPAGTVSSTSALFQQSGGH